MASLITSAADIKTYSGINLTPAAKVLPYQPAAERKLRQLLGTDQYDELVAALPGDVDAKSAALAECLLALHLSAQILGFRAVDDGGLARTIGAGDYETELMSPRQTAELAQLIYGKALEAIRHLIPDIAIDDTIFKTQADVDAQWQGEGFGFTAVGSNPDLNEEISFRSGGS